MQVEMLDAKVVFEALQLRDPVVVEPEHLQVWEVRHRLRVEALDLMVATEELGELLLVALGDARRDELVGILRDLRVAHRERRALGLPKEFKEGVLFSTYSTLVSRGGGQQRGGEMDSQNWRRRRLRRAAVGGGWWCWLFAALSPFRTSIITNHSLKSPVLF